MPFAVVVKDKTEYFVIGGVWHADIYSRVVALRVCRKCSVVSHRTSSLVARPLALPCASFELRELYVAYLTFFCNILLFCFFVSGGFRSTSFAPLDGRYSSFGVFLRRSARRHTCPNGAGQNVRISEGRKSTPAEFSGNGISQHTH